MKCLGSVILVLLSVTLALLTFTPRPGASLPAASHIPTGSHGSTGSDVDTSDTAWEAYKVKYNKVYRDDEEEEKRKGIWKNSVHRVAQHNAEADAGQHSWWMGINHFSDLTEDEFKKMYLMDGNRGPQRKGKILRRSRINYKHAARE